MAMLAGAMLLPMMADLVTGNANWQAFAISALITGFIGVSLWIANQDNTHIDLGLRQAFLLTNGGMDFYRPVWGPTIFLSDLNLSISDSFLNLYQALQQQAPLFCRISKASAGILLWRALLQWLGGVGIVVMAMAVLPMLSVGGMQLFKQNLMIQLKKVIPRATQLAGGLFIAYTALTAIWAFMLSLAGMPGFDALAHAMTTIATGGYSTRTLSIGAFDSWMIEIIIIGGMIVGSLPFAHYVALTYGGWRKLFEDPQVRWFLTLIAVIVILISFEPVPTRLAH